MDSRFLLELFLVFGSILILIPMIWLIRKGIIFKNTPISHIIILIVLTPFFGIIPIILYILFWPKNK